MKTIIIFLFAAITLSQPAYTQTAKADSTLFDFWVGEWDVWWYGKDSVMEYGSNTVAKILDNTVIQENFVIHSGPNKGFKGQSNSILESQTKIWKQTWVDNSGSYMPFTGGTEGNSRFFEREFMRNGKTMKQKMIFHSITRTSLVWDWTNSTDGGKTWNIVWRIHYSKRI